MLRAIHFSTGRDGRGRMAQALPVSTRILRYHDMKTILQLRDSYQQNKRDLRKKNLQM
jgi:hypothetical protein